MWQLFEGGTYLKNLFRDYFSRECTNNVGLPFSFQIVVYLCDFHREQTWANKTDHGFTKDIEDPCKPSISAVNTFYTCTLNNTS